MCASTRLVLHHECRQRVVNGVRVYIPGHSSHYSSNATYVRKSIYSYAGAKSAEMFKSKSNAHLDFETIEDSGRHETFFRVKPRMAEPRNYA